MYLPTLGRFLSRDPLPQAGDADLLYDNNAFGRQLTAMRNLYGYADGNPIAFTDPSGLDVWIETTKEGHPKGLHHRVTVEMHDDSGKVTSTFSISFGCAGPAVGVDAEGPGEVYQDTDKHQHYSWVPMDRGNVLKGGNIFTGKVKTTAAQDAKILEFFRSLLDRKGKYRALGPPGKTCNCRDFSREIMDEIKDALAKQKSEKTPDLIIPDTRFPILPPGVDLPALKPDTSPKKPSSPSSSPFRLPHQITPGSSGS